MIDADLQYPPEAFPEMVENLSVGYDIVVARRQHKKVNILRSIVSSGFSFLFVKLLHNISVDAQSGLKVFRKEIIDRLNLTPDSGWTFDMAFLINARDAGYKCTSVDIPFTERTNGKSKISIIKSSFEIGSNAIKLKFRKKDPIRSLHSHDKFHYKGKEFANYSKLPLHDSAIEILYEYHKVIILIGVFIYLTLLFFYLYPVLILTMGLIVFGYMFDLLFNFYIIHKAFNSNKEIRISEKQLMEIDENILPMYSILCPLYKEAEVVEDFIASISKIDYPHDKLQVILILEESDTETQDKIKEISLPEYFVIVIVPQSMPQTKPKACNYALKFVKGEYVVIYDAEDRPEVDQLKKVYLGFSRTEEKIICIQAKLNFYNSTQNLLTILFTAEYSLWFDLILPGLQTLYSIIPLGGTSNHFKTDILKSIHGWDAFNVTEDCDLGIRLSKLGYATEIIDSYTMEEANSKLSSWFKQRSRWIKGYMQSYIVHMRNPVKFIKQNGLRKTIILTLVIGGKVLLNFINPIMWIVTILYFVFTPITGHFIRLLFPQAIFYMSLTSLIIGNFLYFYLYLIALIKTKKGHLVLYTVFIPFYWLMMSYSSMIALKELFTAPHLWHKTKHGLMKKSVMKVTS